MNLYYLIILWCSNWSEIIKVKSFHELLILLKIWLFLIGENQNVNIKKRINRKKFSRFFSLLESVVSWLQITRSVPKKGLRKVSKAFFVWLVSFRQKLHKSSELLKRRGPVTGIFYLMNSDLFAHQTNRPSYYYNKDLLVLLPRNSYMKTKFSAYWEISGTMPHL